MNPKYASHGGHPSQLSLGPRLLDLSWENGPLISEVSLTKNPTQHALKVAATYYIIITGRQLGARVGVAGKQAESQKEKK